MDESKEQLEGGKGVFNMIDNLFRTEFALEESGSKLEIIKDINQGFAPWVQGVEPDIARRVFDIICSEPSRREIYRWLLKAQGEVINMEGIVPEETESANDKFSEILEELLQRGVVREIVYDPNKRMFKVSLVGSVKYLDQKVEGSNNIKPEILEGEGIYNLTVYLSHISPPDPIHTYSEEEGVHRAAFGGKYRVEVALFNVKKGEDKKTVWTKLYGFRAVAKQDALNEVKVRPTTYTKYESTE